MRINQPVTNRERTFPQDVKLISVTDLNSHITDCNQAFVDISGFTKEELLGQPHNLVRHPDMPPEAFKVMWQHLREGKAWMGLVKNRCKNGDFYWVDAYVTPVTDKGKVIGYESVRSSPKPADVRRAEALYRRINEGRAKAGPAWGSLVGGLLPSAAVLAGIGFWFAGWPVVALAWLGAWPLLVQALAATRSQRVFKELNALTSESFSHPLAAASYTEEKGPLGMLKVAVLSGKAHLGTVLTRIESVAAGVSQASNRGLTLSQQATANIRQQQVETDLVATAMTEMTASIANVSNHVKDSAQEAEQAATLAGQSMEVAVTTRGSIEQLNNTVSQISQSVTELAQQTNQIAAAAEMIEQIAEQTNLLALNAAIEAARAGEQGRGFAVVADEVRHLAQRTQQSTRDIYAVVNHLIHSAKSAEEVAKVGKAEAEAGLSQVFRNEQMLQGIAEAVNRIAAMSEQMANVIDQQQSVSEEINEQVVNISAKALDSLEQSELASSQIQQLERAANDLHELVSRFRR
ncbi:methyl-accepting chemotaxis protein [Shewanella cyperi]|uniref:methyl-accepting chemotaxis protein n=1 Tax=Shewanella cyperi TaxID=2814292 RepID=UPI001A943165|nr:PAS domain-containing methyl-accepting chemotaxis protein [Shewanella cyperi]QSX40442.1 methyl-accepting chemotaxis protein [Shewanella cyperi]